MNLSEEQKLIRDSVREFVQDRIAPFAAEWDKSDYFPAQELKQMGELGLFGIAIPETWGGSGADYVSFALAIEEVAAGDGACSTILSVNNSVVCGSLLGSGSNFLKQTYLKPLASGAQLGCFCLTEPQAGSDAAALQTRAQKQGDDYVLNGSKSFITSGANADVAIILTS